ncbi:MAG: hypothetical protein OEY14_12500 [Myxococcales bacterium]|nr:hypothetical protein [Myxococcales bacterium]
MRPLELRLWTLRALGLSLAFGLAAPLAAQPPEVDAAEGEAEEAEEAGELGPAAAETSPAPTPEAQAGEDAPSASIGAERPGSTVGSPGRARPARAQGSRLSVRHDTVIRWAPRYEFSFDETPEGRGQGFWRRVDQLPLYQRLQVDARGLMGGHVDLHLSAWGAMDLRFPGGKDLLAGDFASAWASYAQGPLRIWAGRRFLIFGIPGGLHVDGLGADVDLPAGFQAGAFVGRPVTPRFSSNLGGRSSLREPTVATGARLGWHHRGTFASTLSYVERIADGLESNRSLALDLTYRPLLRMDLRGNVVADLRERGIDQARLGVSYHASASTILDLDLSHVDPRRLLPPGSILSVFQTSVFEEGALAFSHQLLAWMQVRAEAALRLQRTQNDDPTEPWGYRLGLALAMRPAGDRIQGLLRYGRRSDGDLEYNLVRAALSLRTHGDARLLAELGYAFDDEGGSERQALLARLSGELPLSERWRVGSVFDYAQTPLARAELRALVRLSFAGSWRSE